jgi:hypothetical protein
LAQGLTKGRARDAETIYEFAFDQTLTGAQFKIEDRFTQNLYGLLPYG